MLPCLGSENICEVSMYLGFGLEKLYFLISSNKELIHKQGPYLQSKILEIPKKLAMH